MKDRIESGAILNEVYHKEKMQINGARMTNEAKFEKNFAMKKREIMASAMRAEGGGV